MDLVKLATMISIVICAVLIPFLNEYVKASISTAMGDPKPKQAKRLTLNPFKHIEPLGFFFMLMFGYGWGKPVETTAVFYKEKKKFTIIAYTLPLIVIVFFVFFGIAILYFLTLFAGQSIMISCLIIFINQFILIGLCFTLFNLIPVYPLNGYHILKATMPLEKAFRFTQNEKNYQAILIILIIFFHDFIPRIAEYIINIFLI